MYSGGVEVMVVTRVVMLTIYSGSVGEYSGDCSGGRDCSD